MKSPSKFLRHWPETQFLPGAHWALDEQLEPVTVDCQAAAAAAFAKAERVGNVW
jgi:hypothetical protein